ncbi:unnamed protein product, partial [Lepidochelys olivacea]
GLQWKAPETSTAAKTVVVAQVGPWSFYSMRGMGLRKEKVEKPWLGGQSRRGSPLDKGPGRCFQRDVAPGHDA